LLHSFPTRRSSDLLGLKRLPLGCAFGPQSNFIDWYAFIHDNKQILFSNLVSKLPSSVFMRHFQNKVVFYHFSFRTQYNTSFGDPVVSARDPPVENHWCQEIK